MARKSKIDPAEKVKVVERLLAAEIGVCEAGRLTGVDGSTIRQWRDLYLSDGPTALMAQRKNKVYSQE
ncbi:MAG: transposase, partial [Lachnospiraceae bacterium]|nr:transposase [Lachnospiraceae bacterium]